MDRLLKFGVRTPLSFVFHNGFDRMLDHLYFECQVTTVLWTRLPYCLGIQRSLGT